MAEIVSDLESTPKPEGKSAAGTVAVGIFSSRIIGFVRDAVIGYFFGVSAHTDVYRMAFRGPNVLQNLLGEGTISAAFIPIYSRLLHEGREEEAGRFAGAIFGLMLAAVSGFVLFGVLLAPYIVALLSPGFVEDAGSDLPAVLAWLADLVGRFADGSTGASEVNRYALAVQGVRIIFPMTGILVLSAWALGILNSHRHFFLPYFAPVLWNIAIITALFGTSYYLAGDLFGFEALRSGGIATLNTLLIAAFFGALAGGLLQFLVQVPMVMRLLRGFRFSFSTKVPGVKKALRAFWPIVAGRGAYQLSTWIDLFLASLLAAGALGALGFAQNLYILPISLFGMSVAASELPELSRLKDADTGSFLYRMNRSIRQILFLTIPTFVGYLVFGLLLIRALFERGRFGLNDSWLIYMVLGGYSLGLLATTASRLMQNAFYALNDTKTPAKIAVVRMLISAVVAVPLMFWLDHISVTALTGLPPQEQPLFFGAVGLSAGSAVGAWVELLNLRAVLHRRLNFTMPWQAYGKMLTLAGVAAAPAGLLWWLLPGMSVVFTALLVVGLYAGSYLALARLFHYSELEAWTGRFFRKT